MRTRKVLTLAILLPALSLSFAGKKDKKNKKGGESEPESGWVMVNAEAGQSCYKPPNYSAMPEGPARLARAAAISAIIGQWRGERDDGVSFSEKTSTNVETVLFGDPKDIDIMAPENYDWCKKVLSGKAAAGEWHSWANGLKARLTKGECKGSLLPQTMYDYLDIGAGWQIPAPFCKGEEIVIEVSAKDLYRIDKGGPWINGAGDPAQPATGSLPCTIEGCNKGTVILQFTSDEGTETIEPVGTGRVFRVPSHGILRVMINEEDFNDNEWKIEGGLQHHASVGYSPK